VFLGPTAYQPLVGWVVDRGGWRLGMGVLAAVALAGLLAALRLRETFCRNVASGDAGPGAPP
jgi:predicted acyltransferase